MGLISLRVNYIRVVSLKVLEFRYEYIVHQFCVQYQQFRSPIRVDANERRFATILSVNKNDRTKCQCENSSSGGAKKIITDKYRPSHI